MKNGAAGILVDHKIKGPTTEWRLEERQQQDGRMDNCQGEPGSENVEVERDGGELGEEVVELEASDPQSPQSECIRICKDLHKEQNEEANAEDAEPEEKEDRSEQIHTPDEELELSLPFSSFGILLYPICINIALFCGKVLDKLQNSHTSEFYPF